ncbi:MAG: glycosyltransferase family 4 protein [Candidatus Omnitrophota bacterium]
MNILVIIPYNLFTTKNGNAIRIHYMIDNLVKGGHKVFSLMYDVPLPGRRKVSSDHRIKVYLFSVKIELLLAAKFFSRILKTSIYDPLSSWMTPVYKFKSRINRIIKKNKIDIIQCENVETYLPVKKSVTFNIPIVLTAHDVITERFKREFQARNTPELLRRFFLNRIKKLEITALKNCRWNICLSEHEQKQFLQMGINRETMHIIANGVDTQKIQPLPKNQEFQKSLGINRDDPVLFFGGSDMLQNTKAIDALSSIILPELINKFPNLKMIFTGTVSRYIKKTRLERLYPKNILNVGYVDSLRDYYSIVDIVVLPITIGAGMKSKAAEAFAAGKSVVTTSMAVVGYEVSNGEDLIIEDNLAEFPRHICTLLRNKVLRDKFSRNIRQKALKYDWHILMQKYNDIYNKLLPAALI